MKKLLLAVVVWLATLSAALAQGTVLQGGPWAPGHQPMYVGPNGFGGQTIVQDGGGSAGGPLGVNPSELGITSRSPTGSYPSANSGNGQFGSHSCMYDAPTTNPSGYHYLCFDPDANGGGLISYGAGGTAPQLPLQVSVNGVISSGFPLTNPIINGSVNVFGDGNGIYTGDGSVSNTQSTSTTADNIYSGIISTGYYFYDVNRSVLDMESGTTVQNADAYGYYIKDDVAYGSGPNAKNAVGYFGVGVAYHANASIWGGNFNFNDSPNNTTGNSFASIGHGLEFDFSVYNTGTIIVGASFLLGGAAEPSDSAAVSVGVVGSSVWTASFVSNAGAAQTGAIIGAASASGTNINSQPIDFGIFDSSAVGHYLSIEGRPFSTGGSVLQFQDNILTDWLDIAMGTGGGGAGPEIFAAGTDADVSLLLSGKGTGVIYALSSVLPFTDASITLGAGSHEWSAVYADGYYAGVTAGVTCPTGSPTSSFATVGGIVTHC